MTKPLKSFAAGGVRAAVWENEIQVNGSTKAVLKASVERRYRDKSGTWKSSTSFSRNEIPLAVYRLEKAFETIVEEEKGDNGNRVAGDEIERTIANAKRSAWDKRLRREFYRARTQTRRWWAIKTKLRD